jgi:hypothetical protein
VLFLGWNKVVAGALAADGRRQLTSWLAQGLRRGAEGEPVAGGLEDDGSAEIQLVRGFVPTGTEVQGGPALERLLAQWVKNSNRSTVGDVESYGGSAVITVTIGADQFVLNRDTKRAAVHAFLAAATQAGGAGNLPWHITANRNGTVNRVSYRPDDQETPGWYAYVRRAASEPRDLG